MLGTRYCGNGDLLGVVLNANDPTGANSRLDGSRGPVITSYTRWADEADDPDDEALRLLAAELRAGSDAAASWWEAHDVAQKRHGVKRYIHPTVGELTLHYEAVLLPDDGDQLLTIYAAEPGTPHAERLAQLTELAKATA